MASETSICNAALIEIGATTIIDIDDDHPNAVKCKARYGDIRDMLLRGHPWNFAVYRVKLARLVAPPGSEFTYAFQLPTDNLRVLDVFADQAGRNRPPYRIEEDTILSDATDIYLKYVRQVTDANLMTPEFREALVVALASALAIPIKNSKSLEVQKGNKAETLLVTAKSTDGIEDYPERFPESDWVTGRY